MIELINKYYQVLIVAIVLFIYWLSIYKPIRRYKAYKVRRKINLLVELRANILRDMGFDIKTPIRDPHLIKKEIDLMNSIEIPNDEDILKYYKMYCKKFEMDNRDVWTTLQPMSFDDWEKKAKTPTAILGKEDDKFRIMVSGGYLFLISRTCDTMVGIPPNQYYHRYYDYEKMIEEDDKNFMKTLETEENGRQTDTNANK